MHRHPQPLDAPEPPLDRGQVARDPASGRALQVVGVLLDITDNGVGISDQEMSHANWRLDNPPLLSG